MPVRATIGLGTCLIALDASVCFSVNALLPQVAAEFGFGESHAAMLLSTPFYAGRLLAYLVAPMLVPLTSAQYVVGASSLALALSVAWLANGRSLVECGVARFACGVASGPALRAVLALVGRRRPSQAAPFFHLLQSAAVFGALFAQTPLLELARVVGWRRALIASHSLPAAFVSLLVAWTSGRGGGEGQRRLLGSSSHRLHISRAGSASSATMLDGARSWSSPLVDQHDGGADCQGCSGRGDDWLALLREPHLLLFAAAASCLQAAVDQLGGPLGLLALRNGYRRNAHVWSMSDAMLGMTLVFTAALAAQCAAMLLAQPRSIGKNALVATSHCVCLCVALATLALLPPAVPAAPRVAIALAALALGGSAAAGVQPLMQILFEATTSAERSPAIVLVGALTALSGCGFGAALPLLVPNGHLSSVTTPDFPLPVSPIAPALLITVALGAVACTVWLRRCMLRAEMVEHVLILSLESGDEARAVETARERDVNRRHSGALARAPRADAGLPPDARASEQRLLSSLETARDVRQKGSVETMSKFAKGGAASSPPKPYAVDRLVRTQLSCGIANTSRPP